MPPPHDVPAPGKGPPPGGRGVLDGTASWPLRTVALFVDWFASILVVVFLLGTEAYVDGNAQLVVLPVYWLESSLLVSLVGGSFGQLACRIRVVRVEGGPGGWGGRPLPLLPSLLRHLLVLLVVPPLVFRPDGRGLHDLATRSAAVSLRWVRERSERSGR